MIIQIAVGSAIAPITPDVKMSTVVPVPPTNNKIITATSKKRNGIVFPSLANLLPSTFHLLLYVVIAVQAAGKAIALRIVATTISIDFNVPELIITPTQTSAVINTNGIAKFFMSLLEFSYFSTVVSRSVYIGFVPGRARNK